MDNSKLKVNRVVNPNTNKIGVKLGHKWEIGVEYDTCINCGIKRRVVYSGSGFVSKRYVEYSKDNKIIKILTNCNKDEANKI